MIKNEKVLYKFELSLKSKLIHIKSFFPAAAGDYNDESSFNEKVKLLIY